MPANTPRRAKNVRCVIRQQLEAPVDGGAERLLPLGGVDAAFHEELESVRQPGANGRRAEQVRASGRQLDRQRQAIEGEADGGDLGGGVVVDVEVGSHRVGPVDEEPHRGVRRDLLRADGVSRRQRQGWHRPGELACEAERASARREDAYARGGSQHRRGELARCGQHVLTGVQHQDATLAREGVGDGAGRRRRRA